MAEPVETPVGTVTAAHFRPERARRRVVVGPAFLCALFDPRDRMHPVARAFMAFLRDGDLPYRRLVVDDHAVDGAATRLKRQASRENAAALLTTLDESAVYRFESVPEAVFTEAAEAFVGRTDPDASFTDVVVAAHAERLGIDHVLACGRRYDAFDLTALPHRD